MTPAITTVIHLLHTCQHAALATHSRDLPGYPYLSVVPFVPDERHRPMVLISGLAEHTHNLDSDPRSALLVIDPVATDVQAGARMTLLGEIRPCLPDPVLIERYLRYQPSAGRLLQLADFRFFRMRPHRLRFIGGFGQMGWLPGEAFEAHAPFPLEDEQRLLAALMPQLPEAVRLLGIDRWGIDLSLAGIRRRLALPSPPVEDAALTDAVTTVLGTTAFELSPDGQR